MDANVGTNLTSNTMVKERRGLEEDKFRELVWRFIESGGRLDYTDGDGNSLLHLAINRKEEQAIRDLIKDGADPNTRNNQMETPLHRIAYILNIDVRLSITRLLIESGADPFAKDNEGKTFLHNATMNGTSTSPEKLHELAELLDNKMLLKLFYVPDSNKVIPLIRAAYNIEILLETLLLIQRSVDFNSNGHSMLVSAITGRRSIDLISNLIQVGANPRIHDIVNNESLLHTSAKCGNLEACKYLLDLGLKVNDLDFERNTPLQKLAKDRVENIAEIAELLLERGADIKWKNLNDKTALTIAANQRSWELVSILEKRENFTYIKAQPVGRRKILHEAVEGIKEPSDLIRIIISLIKSGTLVNLTNALGETFLHSLLLLPKFRLPSTASIHYLAECLCETNHIEIFSKRGGKNEATPFQLMVKGMEVEERTLLLQFSSGVDFNQVDGKDDSLLAYAICGGRTATFLSSLVMLGADLKCLKNNFFLNLFDTIIQDRILTPSEFHQLVLFLIEEDYIQALESPEENETTPFHLALSEIDIELETLELLHSVGINFNTVDEDGFTPLLYASLRKNKRGIVKIIKFFIDSGADTFADEGNQNTFLHLLFSSTENRRIISLEDFHELTEFLIKMDLSRLFETENSKGETPLHFALQFIEIQEKTLTLLHSAGIDFNMKTKNGLTALAIAVGKGCEESFLLKLIRFGADWKWINSKESLLHYLARQGHLEQLKYLLDNMEFDINQRDRNGSTPLDSAVMWGKRNVHKVANFLIRNGADVKLRNNEGHTLLHSAALNPSKIDTVEVIKLLINSGLDVGEKTKNNNTFMHVLFFNGKERNLDPLKFHELVEFLFDKNLQKIFEIKGGFGERIPLHFAVFHIDILEDTLSLLHVHKAVDFNLVDEKGDSFLSYAVLGKRSTEFLSYLILYGADRKHLDKNGNNLLHISAYFGTFEALKFFLELGELDLNGVDNDGDTPLHCAVQQKEIDKLLLKTELLIKHGAEKERRNNDGLTPLEVVLKRDVITEEMKDSLVKLFS